MKKIFLLTFVLSIFIAFTISPAMASSSEGNDDQKIIPLVNERVVHVLQDNNIDYFIEDGQITLKNPTSKILNNANALLENSMTYEIQQDSISIQTTYPTSWVYMRNYDRVASKKFTKATKTAFSTALIAWLGGITGGATTLARLAAAGFGSYYFLNTDEEDIYYFSKYSYRELGPGRFTDTGTFMGDYEIKKVERVTKNSDGTGGDVDTRYEKSTILEPFF
ncbi:hypothetical protein [Schinkia azotoformans]|uniref:hypothetical protein n=1 Tax=Schinkia azotoformans TaxID=1454 RepID=UPI002DB642B8|nr:hypothetical protein [Schinkia azotoformans]MEC1717901.1 hypothetical protein [Schinkia azotoformans]MEC1741066.1 hypothetical protein [Schinkia azotoformans]MEC1744211.1 hypothetical protein [Schinkia azotoformans]MEC1756631.1 hypothetical protein [Schinkia azotoformans]MEC1768077.1 hypothetical protein [Schinkia azotoformans]